jgi:hypothetical protein
MSELTLEKFMQHYGITKEDVEKTLLNGVYQKGTMVVAVQKRH